MKIGNVVKLKLTGPLMTIELVENESVYCIWFCGTDVKRGQFHVDTLKVIE